MRNILRLLTPPIFPRVLNRVVRRTRARTLTEEIVRTGKVHLGCGPRIITGWANIDLVPRPGVITWDLSAGLPAPDGCLDYAYTEHFVEHVPPADLFKLLVNVRSCLRPGGVLRISTPCIDALIALYLKRDLNAFKDMGWAPTSACRLINEGMRLWGHEFIYNLEELSETLERAGFEGVQRVAWRESTHQMLAGLESRPYHADLIVEARKPK